MRRTFPSRTRRAAQRGIATLTVVAVLFFILSLVAAYTNRNLIFEQRTSGNQVRSTLAFEAAEAGVEWALSLLNAGRIDAACQPTLDATLTSFRQRYLSIDPAAGVITPAGALSADAGSTVWPSCVFDGTNWNCSCQDAGAPVLAAPAGNGVFPAFRVRFVRESTTQASIVRIEVNGCTRLTDGCLDFPSQAVAGEGRATLRVLLALRSALAAPPVAALTVRQGVNVPVAALGAFNADADAGGIALLAGGAVVAPSLRLGSAPGAPSAGALVDTDPGLSGMPDGERFFTSVHAAASNVYRDQSATIRLGCNPCTAADLRPVLALNPGRMIWVDADLDLDAGGPLGTATDPVLIVAGAGLDIDIPVVGVVHARANPTWVSAGAGSVTGAILVENALGGNGSFSAVYDPAVLQRLRWTHGSFVRVPGSWKDF